MAGASTRDRILEAALVEFNKDGVAGASIDEIKARSGASVGSIYHHFGGKVELAGALYLEALSEYQAGFLKELQRAAGAREGVERAVVHHLRWVAGNPELARFLLLAGEMRITPAGKEPLKRANRAFFGAVRRWTEPYIEAGQLRPLEIEVLSALWIGPSQELARQWLARRTQLSLTDAAPELADAAWRCLCP